MAARHCLLVIDDEPDVVHSLKDLLRFDYRVLGANRAAEGFKILEREEVHIVMTDQRMPEMTGVNFLERLRSVRPEVIRLLFTGYADIRAVVDAINQGNVFRYIAKPWDADELQTVLRQASEHYDLVRERQSLLKELQEKNQQLEAVNAEVQRQNQELADVNTELRQNHQLKDAFMRVASHELRTPLTIVLGLADLVRQDNEVAEPTRQLLDNIYNGGLRLNRLIDQMFKVLQAGQFNRALDREQTAVIDFIKGPMNDVAPFISQRHQSIAVQAPDELGTMAVDPVKIHDCVTHLLLNAIKFTPDGGKITLSARRLLDGGLEIAVCDSGVGIDPASLGRIFAPFFTGFDVSRHCSGVYEFSRRGLGLGLTLVKAFIEMHGGQVRVESELGKGSTFILTLPPS